MSVRFLAVIKKTALAIAAALVVTVLGPVAAASATQVLVLPGGSPHVRVFNGQGGALGGFLAYDPAFQGGVSVAIADVTGDNAPEIITGAGPGGGPDVRVYTLDGTFLGNFWAYDPGFGGGVSVAAADLDGDGKAEIVTGPGFGGGPDLRVFNASGTLLHEWAAYAPNFNNGIHVAAGDADGNGLADIVTAPAVNGGPHVRVFDVNGVVEHEWMAYDQSFVGGVSVAAAAGHVITGPASNGGPHVRVFNGDGSVASEWMAYDPGFSGGVTVAGGVVDGVQSVVTGAGPGGGPHVRVFDQSGGARSGFLAYDPSYTGGVNVAAGNGDVVTGAGIAHLREVLASGAVGSGVAGLQQRLLDRGFWLPSVNGKFDSNTTQAVWAFQKANGLPRDGKIGPEDQAALNAGVRPSPVSTSGNLVEVDKARQLLFVVRNGAAQWVFNTSTGSNGHYTYAGHTYLAFTPEGRFTFDRQINGTRVSHLGSLYRPKYFTSAGHAIHGSASIPPTPASHGCVRLSNAAIDFIWNAGLAPLGSSIWVHS